MGKTSADGSLLKPDFRNFDLPDPSTDGRFGKCDCGLTLKYFFQKSRNWLEKMFVF